MKKRDRRTRYWLPDVLEFVGSIVLLPFRIIGAIFMAILEGMD